MSASGPNASKAEQLAAEVIALANYINQYASRALSVEDALKPTGMKRLQKIVDLSEQILEESDP